MILEILALGGFGWLANEMLSTTVQVGYRCKLCDWHTDRNEDFEFDQYAQEAAEKLFKMHVRDAHPTAYPELYPEEKA